MSVAPIVDAVLGELVHDGDSSFVGSLTHQQQRMQIVLSSGDSDASVDAGALSSARRIAHELPSIVERALEFLATFPGFGGLQKVRTMFSLRGIVTTCQEGSFWLEFECSE